MTDIKKKLQDEITVLEYEYLVELPKEILKARAHGDLSENAEYHAAKDRQGFLNARIGHLKKRLADMSMVDFSKIPHDKVGLGSTVVVLDVKRDEEVTYYLVTSEEADAPNGRFRHPPVKKAEWSQVASFLRLTSRCSARIASSLCEGRNGRSSRLLISSAFRRNHSWVQPCLHP